MDVPDQLKSQPLLEKVMQTRVRNLMTQSPAAHQRVKPCYACYFCSPVVIASVVLGPMLAGHQGYVLIQTDNYNIETSVTGPVIMLVLLFVVLLAIEWILRRIFRTGARTRGWFIGRSAPVRASKPKPR